MKILVDIPVDLSPKQVETIGRQWLSSLAGDEWVEERRGKLVLMHEVATSHRFDTEVSYQDPVRIALVKAVQDFQKALKEYEKAFAKDGRK